MHYGRYASGELCTNNLSHKQRTLKTHKKEQTAHEVLWINARADDCDGTGGHKRDLERSLVMFTTNGKRQIQVEYFSE